MQLCWQVLHHLHCFMGLCLNLLSESRDLTLPVSVLDAAHDLICCLLDS